MLLYNRSVYIRLRSSLFPQDFFTTFLIIRASMDATCPTHILSLNLISQMPFAGALHSTVSSTPLNPLSRPQNILLISSMLSCLLQRNRPVKRNNCQPCSRSLSYSDCMLSHLSLSDLEFVYHQAFLFRNLSIINLLAPELFF